MTKRFMLSEVILLRNKFIDIFLILLILIIFTGYFLYRNHSYSGRVLIHLLKIEQNIQSGDWQQAKENSELLKNDWHHSKGLLLFNFASEEYLTLDNTIDKIAAGIEAEDKGMVLSDLLVIHNLWNNYTKIVPEP